jgi:hypothetical protein
LPLDVVICYLARLATFNTPPWRGINVRPSDNETTKTTTKRDQWGHRARPITIRACPLEARLPQQLNEHVLAKIAYQRRRWRRQDRLRRLGNFIDGEQLQWQRERCTLKHQSSRCCVKHHHTLPVSIRCLVRFETWIERFAWELCSMGGLYFRLKRTDWPRDKGKTRLASGNIPELGASYPNALAQHSLHFTHLLWATPRE